MKKSLILLAGLFLATPAMAGMSMEAMGHKEANVISTEPGETKELVWHFTQAGTFDFASNYPGHAEVGMEGRIAVK